MDLSLTYDLGDSIEIYGGVNHLFDEDPPIIVGQGWLRNTFPATYDYAGMTVFMGVTIGAF